jgi:phosphoglucosamine mutase
MSNLGLEDALKTTGLELIRAQVGDRYVLEMMVARGCTLGGESSGHIICLDRVTTGDGIVSALQVLRAAVERDTPLHELRRGMSKYPQVLINVRARNPEALAQRSEIARAVAEAERELGARGRILIRPSGTEPLIRVMVEGSDASQVAALAKQLAGRVQDLVD